MKSLRQGRRKKGNTLLGRKRWRARESERERERREGVQF